MGFLQKLFGGGKSDFTNVGFQMYKDKDTTTYQELEQKEDTLKDVLFFQAPSREEFAQRVKEEKEKQMAKYKSPYLKKYEQFMAEARKNGYDPLLFNELNSGPVLFEVEKLDRISRFERSFIEHTGFNKDAFPEGTEIFYFDEFFSDTFTSENYQDKKGFIAQYLDEYLLDKGVKQCCIKISQEEFLYASRNNIAADAVEYNYSLVDKNNNVKDVIIYEEDGKTVNNSAKLLAILQMEVEYLDLIHKKEFRDIGDIPLSTYADPKLPYSDKIYIKNQILIDLYESRKYDKDTLDLFRKCLKEDIDIGYILNPSYTIDQRKRVLDIAKDFWNDDRILKNLRDFSTKYGTHFEHQFTENQFGYILDCIQFDKMDGFTEPPKLAEMDLEYYKDMALISPTNSYEFRPENSDKVYILTKDKDHEEYDEFRLEEVEYDENGKKIGQYLIYEKQGENETPREGLDTFLLECQKAHFDQDSHVIFEETLSEVIETISDIEKHGHVHVLYTEDSSAIQIEGIRSEKKELTEDEEMAIFLGGQRNENTINQEDAGVTITIIKDGEFKVLYSDSPDKKAMFESIDEVFAYIMNEHGSFTGRHDVRTMPISVSEKTSTLSENIEKEKTLLYKEKYKSLTQKKLEQMINFSMKKRLHSTLTSNDEMVTLLFEPYFAKDGENTYSNCNIYKIENGEKTPVYVKSLDEKGIEHISGSMEDAIHILLANDFAIQESSKIVSKVAPSVQNSR